VRMVSSGATLTRFSSVPHVLHPTIVSTPGVMPPPQVLWRVPQIEALMWRPYHRRWLAVLGAVLLSLSACSSWRVQPVEPAAFVREHGPNQVRITRSDRSTIVLHQPAVVGDSIGVLVRVDTAGVPDPRAAVALSDIRAIAVRRTDGLKTAGACLGGALVGAFIICAASSCMDWSLGS
jgi:hypothetical protein